MVVNTMSYNCYLKYAFLQSIHAKHKMVRYMCCDQLVGQTVSKSSDINPKSATYILQQTKISNFSAFSKITNKA